MTEPMFDKELIKRACGDGDIDAMEELSGALLTQAKHNKSLHPVVPNSLINNFAYRMLKRLHEIDRGPPELLIQLLQIQLSQDKAPQSFDWSSNQQMAAEILAASPNTSINSLASQVSVDRQTIRRWKDNPDFQKLIEGIKRGVR